MRRGSVSKTNPPRRLGRGQTQKAQTGRRSAFAKRRGFRKKREAGAACDESRERGERPGTTMNLPRSPHRAGSQHLVPQTVAFRQRQERPEVGLRYICCDWGVTQRAERGKPLGAAGEQKAVLEELLLTELHHSQREGEDCRVETPGEEARHEFIARSFQDIEFDWG